MFPTLISIALLAAAALRGVSAEFAISTPALTQCKDAKISWESTKGPYNLLVVKAEDPCGDPLVDAGDHNGTTMTWKTNLPSGTKVQLSLEDANGDEAWSGQITIAASDDSSCLPADVKVNDNNNNTNHSASSSDSNAPTTLVVTPTTTIAFPSASDSAVPSAIGAAGNAGANPFSNSNGVLTGRLLSVPALAAALFATLAVTL